MRSTLKDLLAPAQVQNYGVGAFNIYNLEGATAVVQAAEELNSPVILQLLPSALKMGGRPLVSLCTSLADKASVPVAVHLDHCSSAEIIDQALGYGVDSVMADGSELDLARNISFTREIVERVRSTNGYGGVEAELGKISGMEDGEIVEAHHQQMTKPDEALTFVRETGADALAVCIGNVHGTYHRPPQLDFNRLDEIAAKVNIPLVLHGTSGLPDEMITRVIGYGVCKFNVNTEIRSAYLGRMRHLLCQHDRCELTTLMKEAINSMKDVVKEKIRLFGSAEKVLAYEPS
ncbi:MAG: class II fructose-bisphosphate aldolase [Desulfobulbaceae bacterium]|nr:MAG: class II fructose-bisphosphate aldolase [Desulfobulbaceae bacterium]